MYLLEQIDMHGFGGTGMAPTGGLCGRDSAGPAAPVLTEPSPASVVWLPGPILPVLFYPLFLSPPFPGQVLSAQHTRHSEVREEEGGVMGSLVGIEEQ